MGARGCAHPSFVMTPTFREYTSNLWCQQSQILKSWCHTKRRMGAHGRAHLLLVWHQLFRIWLCWHHRLLVYSHKVGVMPKEGWTHHSRPSFFWFDNDKDLKVCFLVTRVICVCLYCYVCVKHLWFLFFIFLQIPDLTRKVYLQFCSVSVFLLLLVNISQFQTSVLKENRQCI